MDDAGIRAELSSLRSSITALDRRMSELLQQVGALDRHVDRVGDSVATFSRTVVPAVSSIQSRVTALADEFARSRVIDLARDRRDDLDRERMEKFGKHDEVRKLANTIIRVVSTGVIDDKVILDTAQRRMIDLPDFWLAPATVAVAAWLSRDKGKCDEALALALRLDRSKTALFMTLLLRHDNRTDALQHWIGVYLTGLHSTNLPADFQVVVDGVAGGALGDGSAPRLAEWMTTSYLTEAQSRDARTEATEEWRQRLLSMGTAGDFAPTLASCCPDWASLRDRHSANVMIEAAERHFRGRFEAGADIPADLTERMRALVTKLADTPDGPEDKLRRDRRLEDFVIRFGDREEARRQLAAEEIGRTGALNILSLVSASAYPASEDGKVPAPTMTELLTIVLSSELIGAAADTLRGGTSRPAEVKVTVGRFRTRACTFDCATDAEVTREALNAQAAAEESRIIAEIRQETFDQQHRLRRFARRPLPTALASCGVVAAVPFVISTGLPVIDFAAPAIAIAAGAGSRLAFLLRRRWQVESTGARETPAISKTLRDCAAELADFFEQEARGARSHDEFRRFLRDLTPDHAYRAVRKVDSPPFPRSREFPEWTPMPPEERPELGHPDGPPLPLR
jgi:hypothetical protein